MTNTTNTLTDQKKEQLIENLQNILFEICNQIDATSCGLPEYWLSNMNSKITDLKLDLFIK
jgi:hypothetical protein